MRELTYFGVMVYGITAIVVGFVSTSKDDEIAIVVMKIILFPFLIVATMAINIALSASRARIGRLRERERDCLESQ